MRIAIFGATSQIAKDLVLAFHLQSKHQLVLYSRRPNAVTQWLRSIALPLERFRIADFSAFNLQDNYDAILNFVGVGNPVQAIKMGFTIFEVTRKYDEMALDYVQQHPDCRYVFISSGAAYGSSFDTPVDENTKAGFSINNIQSHDWYGIAKFYSECCHRALPHLAIVDVRVFSYFSHTQDMTARYLMTDIVRAVRDKTLLITSIEDIVRDYIHPSDFFNLIDLILRAPMCNDVVDCYSLEAISKAELLQFIQNKYGMQYEGTKPVDEINATGRKKSYFSRNHRAKKFGYYPTLTSLAGIAKELQSALPENTKFNVT